MHHLIEKPLEQEDGIISKVKVIFIKTFIGKVLPNTKKLSLKDEFKYER